MSDRSEREIRESIAETRARMGDTIEQIGDRVNPDRVKADLKAHARSQINEAKYNVKQKARSTMRDVEHGVSDAGRGIWATIKDNPVPAGMVGVGLAWLLANRRDTDDYRYDYDTYSTGPAVPYRAGQTGSHYGDTSVRGYESTRNYGTSRNAGATGYSAAGGTGGYGAAGSTSGYGATGSAAGYGNADRGFEGRGEVRGGYTAGSSQWSDESGSDGIREKASDVIDSAGERLGEAQERVGEAVHGAQERMGEAVHGAQERVSNAVHSAGDRVSSLAGQARSRARSAEYRVEESLRENPVAAGAVALAIGMAAGLMIPETDREHRMMGRARDRAFDKAQDAVRRSADKLHDAARDAAGESARHAVDEIWPGADEDGSESFSEPRR